ncbi:MAG: hypothetical protein M3Q06_03480 [Bacteroidota bacterium]|nr:hypothetical protein [Bacteroidota bacterium]
MRRILPFEISMATKDRPKTFQVITLLLFSFSIAVIVVSSLQHLTTGEEQVVKRSSPILFSDVTATSSLQVIKR